VKSRQEHFGSGRLARRSGGDGIRPSERGAVLVEFALVLPLLAMLLVGTVSAGLAYNQKLDVTHATREGARYGAAVSPAQLWASGNWATNVRDIVVARSGGDLTSAQVCVSLVVSSSASASAVYSGSGHAASYYTTTSDGSACYADTYSQFSSTDNGLRVQILASRPGKIDLVVWPSVDLTLTSKATAKSEALT
jgi:Flp pilus assembly protein TadG